MSDVVAMVLTTCCKGGLHAKSWSCDAAPGRREAPSEATAPNALDGGNGSRHCGKALWARTLTRRSEACVEGDARSRPQLTSSPVSRAGDLGFGRNSSADTVAGIASQAIRAVLAHPMDASIVSCPSAHRIRRARNTHTPGP